MKTNCKVYFLIFSFLLFNCDPNVIDKTFDQDNLISVTSFISPQDTVLMAHVYYGQKLGTNMNLESAVVDDALVTVGDSQTMDTLIFNVEKLRYEAPPEHLVVEANKKYRLNVRLSDGRSLTSECIIPAFPENPILNGDRDGNNFQFKASWSSFDNYPYYILSTRATGTYEITNPRGTFTVSLLSVLDEGSFIVDKQKEHNARNGNVSNAYLSTNPGLKIYLRNVDHNMYSFYKTLIELDEWNSNTGNLIPNFREPQSVYSNIIGGAGVFGGYNLNIEEFDIN
jgi:hypothetical protein